MASSPIRSRWKCINFWLDFVDLIDHPWEWFGPLPGLFFETSLVMPVLDRGPG
jgi:hypothetical protein